VFRMSEEPRSTQSQIKEALIGWGVPALCASIPALAWIDAFSSVLRSLGWRFVALLFSLLLFGAGRLYFMWRKEKAKVRSLEAKLENDFKTHLEPVKGKGVYRDKRNGEIICPRCVAERNTPSPMAAQREHYVCGACENMVSR